MKTKYLIRGGASFRMPDGSVKTSGEEIELDSDVALTHAGLLEAAPAPPPEPEPTSDTTPLPDIQA